jgi:hypothetical protein
MFMYVGSASSVIMSPTSTTRWSSGMFAPRFWIAATSSRKSGDSGLGSRSWGCQFVDVGFRSFRSCRGRREGEKRARVWKRRQRGLRARATANGERDAEGVASSRTATERGGVRFI